MRELFSILSERCQAGRASMLVTIVTDRGSAPRGTGASMLVDEAGRLAGTIGGGMLEFRAVQTARQYLQEGKGGPTAYNLSMGKAGNLGMACGGDVDVLFSLIAPEAEPAVSRILERLEKHETSWLVLPFTGNGLGVYTPAGLHDEAVHGLREFPEPGRIGQVRNGVLESSGCQYYIYQLQNESRVYVFGGGHLAQETVPLLTHLGFRCVLTDDRPEYATPELFPDAEETHVCAFSELRGKFDVHEQDYIIVVTRGHLGDFEAEGFALTTPAHYIGVVGSRAKIRMVSAKLLEAGFSEQDLARVTTPIGIDIRSETPAEIAVSIAAQLIECRARRRGTKN